MIVPHILDQFYYAHRLRKLGIAPAGSPVRKLTAQRLHRAIDAALELPPDARLQAVERLREGAGIRRAVEILEPTLAA